MQRMSVLKWCGVAGAMALAAAVVSAQYGGGRVQGWWEAGNGESMPLAQSFVDKTGELLIYNANGAVSSRGHAFFEPLGKNGRACVTCHQPESAMSVSTDELEKRWVETKGTDPVFAAVDGANCPNLPVKEKSSHSLLLTRGVFRIFLPWPREGVQPEFRIDVVSDPTGCNTSAEYGLHASKPMISVYRRPRMVANLKYVMGSDGAFTLAPVAGNAHRLMADGREPSLEAQAMNAALTHEQAGRSLTEDELRGILEFESQVYVAQGLDKTAGDLTEVGGPQSLGAWALGRTHVDALAAAMHGDVFLKRTDWIERSGRDAARDDFRESVARGNAIFMTRRFAISDVANLPGEHGKAAEGTCTTCHAAAMTGQAATMQTGMDIGTTTKWAGGDAKDMALDLPLFKVTCDTAAAPASYRGRVIYTNDPGLALVTGRCADVGSIVLQQFRGLTARAPYFANGSAKNLFDVVEFYNNRFAMGLKNGEKLDLVNFMSVL